MDMTSLLKVLSVVMGTSLGVLGLVTETRAPNGRLTRWARWALAGVLASGVMGVVVELRQARAETTRAVKADNETRQQLLLLEKTLRGVARTSNMIPPNVSVDLIVKVPRKAFQSSADEILARAATAGRFAGTPRHVIDLDSMSPNLREQVMSISGTVILDVAAPKSAARDLSLRGEFVPAGAEYEDTTDTVVVWGRPFAAQFIRNTSKLTSFEDLPGATFKIWLNDMFCAVESCTAEALTLGVDDGRTFEVRGFGTDRERKFVAIAPSR